MRESESDPLASLIHGQGRTKSTSAGVKISQRLSQLIRRNGSEGEYELRSAPVARSVCQRTTLSLGEQSRDGEPESGPGRARRRSGPLERLEDSARVLRLDAW